MHQPASAAFARMPDTGRGAKPSGVPCQVKVTGCRTLDRGGHLIPRTKDHFGLINSLTSAGNSHALRLDSSVTVVPRKHSEGGVVPARRAQLSAAYSRRLGTADDRRRVGCVLPAEASTPTTVLDWWYGDLAARQKPDYQHRYNLWFSRAADDKIKRVSATTPHRAFKEKRT